MLPAATKFLLNFNDAQFNIQVRAKEYYGFFAQTLLACGLVFQVPVGILAVTRLGIVKVEQLTKNRRYAYLGCAVLAAALPGVDPVSMLLETAPLIVLYELSIVLARVFGAAGAGAAHRRSRARPRLSAIGRSAKSIWRIGFAGAPAAIVAGGRSRVTTELAPITQRSPTLTPLVTTQLTPNQQLAPISTGPFEVKPCSVIGCLGIVEAVAGVADEAAVGEHRVVADRDPLVGGDHRVAVEEAAGADLDPRLGRQGQPAAGLQQRPFADRQPPLVERLQHLALDRVADEEAAAGGVAVDPPAPQPAAGCARTSAASPTRSANPAVPRAHPRTLDHAARCIEPPMAAQCIARRIDCARG